MNKTNIKAATLQEDVHLTKTQLLAFFGMVVGMFMAILDMQIVASSLSVIGAGLSASRDELSWVQTSYIIAEVIVIPLTGFLNKTFSTRFTFSVATFGFTLMSVLCAFAWNIESMIIFRALQGLFGGALIPSVFATIFMVFPRHQRPTVTIFVGLIVTMAPTLGPTIGGYITEILSWHFMFIVNLIPGIFVFIVTFLYADFDKPNLQLLKNFDYLGVILLIITLSCTEYVLEEGAKNDWFNDTYIIILTLIATASFIYFLVHEIRFKAPIIQLTAFTDRNYTVGCILSAFLGVGLAGSVFLMPLFLAVVAEMDTLQIGILMSVTGIFQFFSAPMASLLFKKGIDRRLMLAMGLIGYGTGCYLNSFLTADSRFDDFLYPQMLRGFSLMFCFMPINDIALGLIPKDKVQNASSLYNLMRNLGSAIGLAVINTMITRNNIRYHQVLGDNLPGSSELVQNTVEDISHMLGNTISQNEAAALGFINNIVSKEAYIITINNIFAYIGLLFISSILLIALTANVSTTNTNAGH